MIYQDTYEILGGELDFPATHPGSWGQVAPKTKALDILCPDNTLR